MVVMVVIVVVGESGVLVGDVTGGARRKSDEDEDEDDGVGQICVELVLLVLESELGSAEYWEGVGVPDSVNHQCKHVVGDPLGLALPLEESDQDQVDVNDSEGGSTIIVGVFVAVSVSESESELDHEGVNDSDGGSTTSVGVEVSVYVHVGVNELEGGSTITVGVHVGELDVPVSLGRVHQSIHVVGEPAGTVVVYSLGRDVVVA
jgi:hypothetical protein